MRLVDVHCHLDLYDDPGTVVSNAKKAGVKAIITQGLNHINNPSVLELSRKYSIVKAALGLYPTDAANVNALYRDERDDRVTDSPVDEILEFIKKNKDSIVAIGEVGLDFKESDDREEQEANFLRIISLAKDLEKPLIIHSRKAEGRVVELLESSGIKPSLVVLHCFSGRKRVIERAISDGFYFSVPCNITRSQHFQMLTSMVPITQLFTETDGPYLPADGFSRSEPAHVLITIKKIAAVKSMDTEEVANNIFMNFLRVFV